MFFEKKKKIASEPQWTRQHLFIYLFKILSMPDGVTERNGYTLYNVGYISLKR